LGFQIQLSQTVHEHKHTYVFTFYYTHMSCII